MPPDLSFLRSAQNGAGGELGAIVADEQGRLAGRQNGRQLADAARLLRPGLKVLFINGDAESAAIGNGHLHLGMELLTKPFTLDDLGDAFAT